MSGAIERTEFENKPPAFRVTRLAIGGISLALAVAGSVQVLLALQSSGAGDLDPLRTLGFGVVLPAVAVALLLALPPSKTREGILMRVGASIQMLLIVGVPEFSLHLLLGLPVVFLVVELFETKLPGGIREPLAKLVVR